MFNIITNNAKFSVHVFPGVLCCHLRPQVKVWTINSFILIMRFGRLGKLVNTQ